MSAKTRQSLEETVGEHGGVIWALDALQPEGHGTLLYVLYEVLSSTPVAAIQLEQAKASELIKWLESCQLRYPVLATLSDGEKAIIEAFRTCWPEAPQQRCQLHFLNNLVEPVLEYDTQLGKLMKKDLGGLAKAPENEPSEEDSPF